MIAMGSRTVNAGDLAVQGPVGGSGWAVVYTPFKPFQDLRTARSRSLGRPIMQDHFSSPEWTAGEWRDAWHIGVGKAYRCQTCSNMIMVVKGGTGTLEPKCHGKPMLPVETKR